MAARLQKLWQVGQEVCSATIYAHIWLTASLIAKRGELDSPGYNLEGDDQQRRLARAIQQAGVFSRWELCHIGVILAERFTAAYLVFGDSSFRMMVWFSELFRLVFAFAMVRTRRAAMQIHRGRTGELAGWAMRIILVANLLQVLMYFRFMGVEFFELDLDAWPDCDYNHSSTCFCDCQQDRLGCETGILTRDDLKQPWARGDHESSRCGYAYVRDCDPGLFMPGHEPAPLGPVKLNPDATFEQCTYGKATIQAYAFDLGVTFIGRSAMFYTAATGQGTLDTQMISASSDEPIPAQLAILGFLYTVWCGIILMLVRSLLDLI